MEKTFGRKTLGSAPPRHGAWPSLWMTVPKLLEGMAGGRVLTKIQDVEFREDRVFSDCSHKKSKIVIS